MNLYFLNTGDIVWTNPANWSDTDGGAPVGIIPVITDDVFFTALSGNCTQGINTPQSIKSLNCIGYIGTITLINATLNIYGNITLSAGMKLSMLVGPTGAGQIQVAADSTITTNGVTLSNLVVTANPITITLMDTLRIIGTLTMANRAIIWTGSYGFSASFLNYTGNASTTITYQAGNVYTVGRLVANKLNGANHLKIVSSIPGTRAVFTVRGDTTIGYVDFTDIDASDGRTLYAFTGVVTNCVNIVSYTDRILPTDTTVAASIIT